MRVSNIIHIVGNFVVKSLGPFHPTELCKRDKNHSMYYIPSKTNQVICDEDSRIVELLSFLVVKNIRNYLLYRFCWKAREVKWHTNVIQ